MRGTINLGLICITAMLICSEKYFIAPYALEKQQQEFVLNMLMLGGMRLPPQLMRPQHINYAGPDLRPNLPQPITGDPDQNNPPSG